MSVSPMAQSARMAPKTTPLATGCSSALASTRSLRPFLWAPAGKPYRKGAAQSAYLPRLCACTPSARPNLRAWPIDSVQAQRRGSEQVMAAALHLHVVEPHVGVEDHDVH